MRILPLADLCLLPARSQTFEERVDPVFHLGLGHHAPVHHVGLDEQAGDASFLGQVPASVGEAGRDGAAALDGVVDHPVDVVVVDHLLEHFFQKAGLADADVNLISAPYTVNLFMLPKVLHCLRSLNSAPIILGGNEPSNNYRNLMHYRFSAFVNEVVDIAPDFIVRGAAETVLPSLLPLLEKTSMTKTWDNGYVQKILDIPNLVFWLPEREALFATKFSSENLSEKDIFSYVKYGENSVAITLQRACVWAKKSRGGCLFCAIASQFGQDFHCAVDGDFFIEELRIFLENNPQIQYIDIWDDTFNIDKDWAIKICGYLKTLNHKIGREIRYTCFLRPKGLDTELVTHMKEANIRTAFMGADALTEELSKRLRRGCTISEMNRSIEVLAKGNVLPSLSVQLFSPESTVDDVGITSTVALDGIKNGKSTVHVHLYTFPLYGSDIYRLLKARKNLKKIPISGNFADKELIDYVKINRSIIGTMDKALKKQIKESGGSVLSLTHDKIILES